MADDKSTDAELVDWASLEDHAGPEAKDLREKLAESQRWRRRQAERIQDLLDDSDALARVQQVIDDLKAIHINDEHGFCIGCDGGTSAEECNTTMIINGSATVADIVTYEEDD